MNNYKYKEGQRYGQYCLKKGIYLVRIPYWEYNNTENIIKNIITGDFND